MRDILIAGCAALGLSAAGLVIWLVACLIHADPEFPRESLPSPATTRKPLPP